MTIRIGINGFGRIGRNIFRAIRQDAAFADMQIASATSSAVINLPDSSSASRNT